MTIRGRIVWATIAISAIASVASALYLAGRARTALHSDLQAKAARDGRLLAAAAARPLQEADVPALTALLDAALADPDLLRLDVGPQDGPHQARVERPSLASGEQTWSTRTAVVSGSVELGEIRSTYSTAALDARLAALRSRLLLAALGLTAGLGLVAALLARRMDEPFERLTAEHRRAEEERARLVSILEATSDFVGMAEPDGRALYVNKGGRAMTGMGDAPAENMRIADFHPPWAAQLVQTEGIPSAVAKGEWAGDMALVGPGGAEVPVSQVLLAHKDAEGRVRFLSTIMRDMTERHEAVAADRRLASIVRYSKDFIALADVAGRVQFVNEYGKELVGAAPAQDLSGMSTLNFIHESSRSRATEEAMASVMAGGHWSGFLNFRHLATGEAIPMQFEGFRIDDVQGRPLHIATVSRDMRETQRTQAALEIGEERLRQAVRVAQIGIYDHDQQTDTLYWSAEQRALFGIGSGEPVSLPAFIEQVHPDDRAIIGDAVRRAHDPATDGSFDVEYRIVRRDSAVRWISNRGRTFFEGEGNDRRPVRSVGAIIDITERHAADEERTRLQAQLAHAQRLETVGRLAGGVAHDFNNMLQVIMGFAELLSRALPTSPLARYVDEIVRAASRARDVTRQLLAYSRRQMISPTPSNLNALVSAAHGGLARLIGEDVELRFVAEKELWTVTIDPAQFDQVLMNLVVNARDAMPNGGKLTIETTNVLLDAAYCRQHVGAKEGQYVLLAVSDDGVGIDKEMLAHIFEPFFTTKELGKGTGLGLATVYGVVDQNGGFITVYSEPGHGTTFKVYLPRVTEPSAGTTNAAASAVREGGGTVLLVEDEELVRRVTSATLEAIGYSVLEAATPAEAIAYCEAGVEVDLVLTDVVMPGMSGPDLADRLRPLKPGLKVLFTSGYTANVITHHGILKPGVHFIPKPFGMGDLARKLREVLAS